MNRRFLFSLLGAVLCGLIAIWITQRIILNSTKASPANFTKVLVAAAPIPPGTTITDKMVKFSSDFPKTSIPSGTIVELTQVVGKVSKSEIGTNNFVLTQNLMKVSDSPVLGGLSEGNRAMAIRVDEASSIGGFATPGNHVDVVAVLSPGGGAKQVSKIIAQDLKILATNQTTQEINGAAQKLGGTVTLEVTQAQAAILTLAMREGNLHLIGRNPSDRELHTPPEIVMNDTMNRPLQEQPTPRPIAQGNTGNFAPPVFPSPKLTPSPTPSVAPTKMTTDITVWKGSVPTVVQLAK
jgi:pilus assembly protein CpaB